MKSRRIISRDEAAALELSARIRVERAITDAKLTAQERAGRPATWELEAYARQSPWRRSMFSCLGSVAGRTVLDLGCGYHPTPVYFALAGAGRVYACDVSASAVAHIRRLARERGVGDRVAGLVCAAEELPLRDGSVDLVHGEAVLHHLAIPLAALAIARVLRPGGKAVFKDPLGQNAVFEIARDYLKRSAKATDRPLRFSQLREFGAAFERCTYRGFGLVATCAAAVVRRSRWAGLARAADRVDGFLLARFPALERYCQYVVTCAEK